MSPYRRYFWISLGLLTLFRLWFIGQFELCPDEAYYWTWSRHLDWSYYDQGPMLALIIRCFTFLSGQASAWSVRLGAVLLSVLSSWLFFESLNSMFQHERPAWYGFLALQSALLFSTGAVLMMHDSIMLCAWIGALFFFYRALVQNWNPGWIYGSLALGLGGLAKYSMALFVLGLLLFLIISPPQRIWWRKPHLYLSAVGTLALVSPVWLWNFHHGWASLGHLSDLSGWQKAWQISWQNLGTFLGGQLGVMTPLLGLLCLYAPWWAWKKWRQGHAQAETYLYLFCFSAPLLLFFLLLSARTNVYANWPAPAYPAALGILAGWFQEHWNQKSSRAAKYWMAFTLGTAMLITLLVHGEVLWGVLPLKGNAAESIDRIRGWQSMGQHTAKLLAELKAAGQKDIFLAARRYQIASLLAFYTPGQPEVELLSEQSAPNNQYRFWDHSAQLAGHSALFVCEHHWESEHLSTHFRSLRQLENFTVTDHNRPLRQLLYYWGEYFLPLTGKPQAK